MNIAFITSMKYGLSQFIFRDIEAFDRKGHGIKLIALRKAAGLYNPPPGWTVISPAWAHLIWKQLRFLLRHPVMYLHALLISLTTLSMADLLFAVGFAENMTDVEVMYAYFGDHKLFIGYYLKLITGIPLVVSIRAYELYNNPNRRLFPRALAACDSIVTISDHNRDYLVNHFGIPAGRIEVVRQILDLEAFQPRPRIKILIVGFFTEKKGHEILFRALKLMNRNDVELWVVGDITPDVTPIDCRQLARDIGVEHQVAFFGVQQGAALRALYRECDIFCLPSRTAQDGDREGFPNVIAEAMAFGKPVVSTYHAGIPEVVDSLLVEENNVEQLAAALNTVCDSAELRVEQGRKNRARVEQMFSGTNNDRLESILNQYTKRSMLPAQPLS